MPWSLEQSLELEMAGTFLPPSQLLLQQPVKYIIYYKQEILLDCDQSNVLLERIIFFCIL